MAQYFNFWQYHGDEGLKFKTLIIDAGLWCKRIGYPIGQINNAELLQLYTEAVLFKRVYKANPTARALAEYQQAKTLYYKRLPEYHIRRF